MITIDFTASDWRRWKLLFHKGSRPEYGLWIVKVQWFGIKVDIYSFAMTAEFNSWLKQYAATHVSRTTFDDQC